MIFGRFFKSKLSDKIKILGKITKIAKSLIIEQIEKKLKNEIKEANVTNCLKIAKSLIIIVVNRYKRRPFIGPSINTKAALLMSPFTCDIDLL